MNRLRIALALQVSLFCVVRAAGYPPPKSIGNSSFFGRNIQRTMRLLAESTPEHRNTVRVLFYGQSITDQAW